MVSHRPPEWWGRCCVGGWWGGKGRRRRSGQTPWLRRCGSGRGRWVWCLVGSTGGYPPGGRGALRPFVGVTRHATAAASTTAHAQGRRGTLKFHGRCVIMATTPPSTPANAANGGAAVARCGGAGRECKWASSRAGGRRVDGQASGRQEGDRRGRAAGRSAAGRWGAVGRTGGRPAGRAGARAGGRSGQAGGGVGRRAHRRASARACGQARGRARAGRASGRRAGRKARQGKQADNTQKCQC
jgi:hypothetical protein